MREIIIGNILKPIENLINSTLFFELVKTQLADLVKDLNHSHFKMIIESLGKIEISILYIISECEDLSLREIYKAKKTCRIAKVREVVDELVNLQIIKKEDNSYRFATGIYRKWILLFFENYNPSELSRDFSHRVNQIHTPKLREDIKEYLKYLNESEIDIALFKLGRQFETTLKNYILKAKSKGKFRRFNVRSARLNDLINRVKSEGIVKDNSLLHVLRVERNNRAHGETPSIEERRILLNSAPLSVGAYIDYIKFFDDLTNSL